MKTIDQSTIRKQNVRNILTQLSLHPFMTRQELTDVTGVSLMTVTNLIDLLREQQVLTFTPIQRSGRKCCGRKAENISLCGAGHAWLIVDLSGRQFTYTLMSFDLNVLQTGVSQKEEGDSLEDLFVFLEALRQNLPTFLDGRVLLGVGVVTPGPYEIASDRITNQRLPQLNDLHIKQMLTERLGPYDYYVDEDVKFAVRAFDSLTRQSTCELLYYLYIGEGVGGAAVHNNNLIRGLNATVGDAGQLMDDGKTFESILSQQAFARTLGLQKDLNQETLSSALFELAQQEPARYQAALSSFAQITARMLYNVLWLLDPTHIVIDCRYAAPFADYFLLQVHAALEVQTKALFHLPCMTAAPNEMSSVLRGAINVLQREWVEHIVD